MEASTIDVAPKDLKPSSVNPRKTYENLEGLQASILSKGILQRLIVRPNGKGYEIVCGHRRWKAAQALGLELVPVELRTDIKTDEDVRETQLIENLQRDDIPPLEEAEAFSALLAGDRMSLAEIAAQIGRSESYVVNRIQLCNLSKKARAAMAAGKLGVAAAQVLAKLGNHRDQDDCIANWKHWHQVTVADARDAVGYRLRVLADAPFPRGDAALVKAAGACTHCPKRTSAQPLLFENVPAPDHFGGKKKRDPDRCIDGACWEGKLKAHKAIALKAAKERGATPLTDAQAKALNWGMTSEIERASGYVKATDNVTPKKTWEAIAESMDPQPERFVAVLRNDDVVELFKRADIQKEAKKQKVDLPKAAQEPARQPSSGPNAAEKKRKANIKLVRKAMYVAHANALEQVEKGGLTLAVWRLIALRVLQRFGRFGAKRDPAYLDGLEAAIDNPETTLFDLHSIVADVVFWELTDSFELADGKAPDEFVDWVETTGQDVVMADMIKAERDAAAAKTKPKKAKAKKPAKPKKSAKK